jgi:hypothetical protein
MADRAQLSGCHLIGDLQRPFHSADEAMLVAIGHASWQVDSGSAICIISGTPKASRD